MSAQFKVGDICVGQNFLFSTHRNGMECVVIAGLSAVETRRTTTRIVSTEMRYGLRWADGDVTYQMHHQLSKRRPPASDESAHQQAMLDCIERAKRGAGVEA